MNKIEKMAAREFRKLSKKEQSRRNKLRRLPVAPPSIRFEDKRRKMRSRKADMCEIYS